MLQPHGIPELAGRRLHDVDRHSGIQGHRLVDRGHLNEAGRDVRGRIDRQPSTVPRIAQQRLGLVDVAGTDRLIESVLEPWGDRIVVAELAVLAEHHLQHLFTIDHQLHRHAHAHVVEGRRVAPHAEGQYEGRVDRHDVDIGIALQVVEADARQIPNQIDLAGGDRRQPRCLLGDGAQFDAVDLGSSGRQ